MKTKNRTGSRSIKVSRMVRGLIAILAFALMGGLPLFAESRIALVIGNSAYSGDVAPLTNPVNDAQDISQTLKSLGWTVTLVEDGKRRDMLNALDTFSTQLKANPGSTALFFFAGHGMQVEDKNYLLPLGEVFQKASDIKYSAISANDVLTAMEDGNPGQTLLILDACRDNPLGKAKTRSVSKTRGLSVVAALETSGGSATILATKAGDVAQDGDGRNGTFTAALLKNIGDNLSLPELFVRIQKDVKTATNGQQTPQITSNGILTDFYLGSRTPAASPAVVERTPPATERAAPTPDRAPLAESPRQAVTPLQPATVTQTITPAPAQTGALNTLGWVTVGAGLASGGVSLLSALIGKDAYTNYQNAMNPSQINGFRKTSENWSNMVGPTAIGGASALLTGIIFLIIDSATAGGTK